MIQTSAHSKLSWTRTSLVLWYKARIHTKCPEACLLAGSRKALHHHKRTCFLVLCVPCISKAAACNLVRMLHAVESMQWQVSPRAAHSAEAELLLVQGHRTEGKSTLHCSGFVGAHT